MENEREKKKETAERRYKMLSGSCNNPENNGISFIGTIHSPISCCGIVCNRSIIIAECQFGVNNINFAYRIDSPILSSQ